MTKKKRVGLMFDLRMCSGRSVFIRERNEEEEEEVEGYMR
jgi:hypothetical protein